MTELAPHVIYYCKFNPTSLVIYPSFELFNSRKKVSQLSLENLKESKVKGDLSNKSANRISALVNNWIFSIQYYMSVRKEKDNLRWKYITFITLTLSANQVHDDKYIKREMLNRFIIWMQRKQNVRNYIWKQEVQKNGNLHFHILVDKPIRWESIREQWNDIQSSHGYIQRFFEKNLHIDPNSTDIHGLTKIKDVGAYIAKYFVKGASPRDMAGRCWGCSDSIKDITGYTAIVDSELRSVIDSMEGDYLTLKIESDYVKILDGDIKSNLRKYSKFHSSEIKTHYISQFKRLYFEGFDTTTN